MRTHRKSSPAARSSFPLRLEPLDPREVPAVLTVDNDGHLHHPNFTSIQAAVDAAHYGDVILVYPGRYDEQVVVGPGKDGVVLDSVVRHKAVIAPTTADPDNSAYVRVDGAERVVIEGFTITGPSNELGAGVVVDEGGSAVIHDNLITDIRRDPFDGVQTGVGVVVGNVRPDGTETTGTAVVAGNTITRYQKTGVFVQNAGSFAYVTANTVTGVGPTDVIAQNGIEVGFGADAVVSGNLVSGNVYTPDGVEGTAAYVHDAGRVAVTGNRLFGDEIGVLVENQAGPLSISGNEIQHSTLDGIRLTRTDGAAVVGNRVGDSGRDGIQLEDTTGTTVALNRVDGSGRHGIAVVGESSGNVIIRNDVRHSGGFDGFDATTGTGTVGTADLWALNRLGTKSPGGLR